MRDSYFHFSGLKMTLSWLGLSPYSATRFLGCSADAIVSAQRGVEPLPLDSQDRLEDMVNLLGRLVTVLRETVTAADVMIIFRSLDSFSRFMGLPLGGVKVEAASRMFWRAVTLFFEDIAFVFEDPFLEEFHASRRVEWLADADTPKWLSCAREVVQDWANSGGEW